MNSQDIHQAGSVFQLSGKGLCRNLDTFYGIFNEDLAPGALCIKYRSLAAECCDEGPGNNTSALISVYEEALRFLEQKAADSGFREDLLGLQRGLYRELEYIFSCSGEDERHHFIVVIPVADRPEMLKHCLESLLEQCRIFGYGGHTLKQGMPVYNKIRVMIFDDSRELSNITKIRDMAKESAASGIPTDYIGLEEQTRFMDQLPIESRTQLYRLIGRADGQVPPHKGASITRNTACLYIQAHLHTYDGKTLIYFIDSDEEFRIRARRSGKTEDVQFLNYFYWLDRIFSSSDAEVLTGKVVGDPPVSPAVMINTFLDDLLFVFDSMSKSDPPGGCKYHGPAGAGTPTPEYHDHVGLFGYESVASPRSYHCPLHGRHSSRDCFYELSRRVTDFFYGLHPTRTQFYSHLRNVMEAEGARTVYTGNYVLKPSGLRHFIPFAHMKLRMAGPALGRLLKKKRNGRFVSANLPLLHNRTNCGNYEFRSGVNTAGSAIDLSGEYNRQFWGDVMLFSIEALTALGFPETRTERHVIEETVVGVREKMWKLYTEQRAATEERISRIRDYLSSSDYWWNRMPDTKQAVDNFSLFCTIVEDNFKEDSKGISELSSQVREDKFTSAIVEAIGYYPTDVYLWDELLDQIQKRSEILHNKKGRMIRGKDRRVFF